MFFFEDLGSHYHGVCGPAAPETEPEKFSESCFEMAISSTAKAKVASVTIRVIKF